MTNPTPRVPLIGIAVGALVAGFAAVGALGVAVRLLTRSRIVAPDNLPEVPVAMVMGAEVYADGRPSPFLQARLDLGLKLYRRGLVQRLLVSGAGGSQLFDETGGMRDYLVKAGVPEEDILVDPGGFDTYDSCLRARDLFGLTRVVVVSQRYHLPRALAICRALEMEAWGVGDETVRSSASASAWARGTRRELAANLKGVRDVLTHRPPRSGTHHY